MNTFFKKDLPLIVLFGTLVGLNETLTGSASMPFRSVILNTVSLVLLAVARYRMPKPGTTMLIVMVAVLYKINSSGLQTCTPNVFLCGPTAMLMLGAGVEAACLVFLRGMPRSYMAIFSAALLAFGAFAAMQTYILGAWSTSRMLEYTFLKGAMTGAASVLLVLSLLYAGKARVPSRLAEADPLAVKAGAGVMVAGLWVLGRFVG